MSEGGLRQHIVRDPVGELRERVRRARRDDEKVGAGEMEIDILGRRPARERAEGLRRDEALRTGRHERHDVVASADEKTAHLARLVGGDPSGDPEQDAGHGPHCAYENLKGPTTGSRR
jgi:hypothetical protein